MKACRTILEAPFGRVHLAARAGALTGAYFDHEAHASAILALPIDDDEPVLALGRAQLAEYLAGARTAFELPLAPDRGTAFQREVWRALSAIPFAARASYAELARAIGRPRAVRAVGAANAKNPLSIFVPCHRVIGSDGALTGYAGGLDAKRWLLEHEARVAARRASRGVHES